MAFRTLKQLVTMIRRRLGWSDVDTFQSLDEIRQMLGESQWELNALLCSVHQGDIRVSTFTIATTSGTVAYINPGAAAEVPIARILRVSVQFDGVSVPMRRWNLETDIIDHTPQPWTAATDIRYRMLDQRPESATQVFFFNPTPNGAYSVTVFYGLGPTTFSATDTVNALGHDEYLVLDSMIKCLHAEEADASHIERRKTAYIEALTANETPIDIGQAMTIQDTRSVAGYTDYQRRWPRG